MGTMIMPDRGNNKPRVLIVDDDPPFCDLLRLGLAGEGFATTSRDSAEAALTTMSTNDFDIVVTDLRLPRMDGIELCRRVAAEKPNVRVVVVTASRDLDAAVAALRAGAHDFITKPLGIDQVRDAVVRATGWKAESTEGETGGVGDEILGESPAMIRTRTLCARAAGSDASVLITGESGTGKELVARALHRASRRASGPFVALNCAAVPETLLESELFGYARGAFTDAKAARRGLFHEADGGTLFLDEIGEMSPRLQPKLLRALQERTARPVGGTAEIPFDVRLVAATNENLEAAVAERRFRGDLYFRMNVIPIEVPPLRARGDDVALLARRFMAFYADKHRKRLTGLSNEALDILRAHAWPGNVRELQNAIERAVALSETEVLGPDDLPDNLRSAVSTRSRAPLSLPAHSADPSADPVLVPLSEIERRHVLRVLEAVDGNKRTAARILGLDRRTLYRRLEQYQGRT